MNTEQSRLFWSPIRQGFFDSIIHDPLPEDAIEITRTLHGELMAKQSQGWTISTGPSGKPLATSPEPMSHGGLIGIVLQETRRKRAIVMSVLDGLQASALSKADTAGANDIEKVKTALRDLPEIDLSAHETASAMRHAVKAAFTKIAGKGSAEVKRAFKDVT